MLGRAVVFVVYVLIGGVLGEGVNLYWPHHAAFTIGMLLAAGLWVAVDNWRLSQLLAWLRSDTSQDGGSKSGVWGELTNRMRRMLRERDLTDALA